MPAAPAAVAEGGPGSPGTAVSCRGGPVFPNGILNSWLCPASLLLLVNIWVAAGAPCQPCSHGAELQQGRGSELALHPRASPPIPSGDPCQAPWGVMQLWPLRLGYGCAEVRQGLLTEGWTQPRAHHDVSQSRSRSWHPLLVPWLTQAANGPWTSCRNLSRPPARATEEGSLKAARCRGT